MIGELVSCRSPMTRAQERPFSSMASQLLCSNIGVLEKPHHVKPGVTLRGKSWGGGGSFGPIVFFAVPLVPII